MEKLKSYGFQMIKKYLLNSPHDGLLETKGSSIDRILKRDISGMKDLHIWDYQIFGVILEKMLKKEPNLF